MLKIIPKSQKPPYEDFYRDHYPRVLYYIRNKIGNADAEDLASEIFLYCYSHYDDYNPEKSAITTWLYLIVNSRIKNYYRDLVTYVNYESVCETMQDHGIDMDESIYLEQLHDTLMKAIRTLPERQQTIVMMRYFQNKSASEIALQLGIAPGNVRVLLSRALDKLASTNDIFWKEFKNHG